MMQRKRNQGSVRDAAGVMFAVLTDDECARIVSTAVDLLHRVGARFWEPEALRILKTAGCRIEDGIRVLFPPALVHEMIALAPGRFTLFTREGKPAVEVGSGRAYFGPGPTCPNFIDPVTKERRPFLKRDAALTARVCDALPNIDYVMSLGSVSDVPQNRADVHEFDAMVRETTKPIMSWSFSQDALSLLHRMCAAIKGSAEKSELEPFMIFYAEPTSPLRHSAEASQKLIYCATHRIPIVYTPCPIAGATAPATLAGVLVQNLAETLSGLVLCQLVRKGAPMVVGGVVSILDMRTTILSYGAPELSLLSAAATDVARHLGLPMFSTAGCTDAKLLDEQAAAEATLSVAIAALSRADLVHDVGFIESAMTGSLGQLVMCDELIGMARHVARGIRVDDDTLAAKVIAEGAKGGDYLTLDHTADNFRREFWFPRLMDRRRYGEWAADSRKRMTDRVWEMVAKILAEHHPPALDARSRHALDKIMRDERQSK
ncbi:MAG: trimethylamine methyltransferase family protein [Planctomycetota bacterium]